MKILRASSESKPLLVALEIYSHLSFIMFIYHGNPKIQRNRAALDSIAAVSELVNHGNSTYGMTELDGRRVQYLENIKYGR